MSELEKNPFPEIENLELLARQVVEGFIIGLHKSPFHGFSVEFAEHRLYNPGESTRHLDWRVYARTGKMFVKKYEEETNLRCQLVIDASSSMYFPKEKGRIHKLRFAVYAAASLIHLLKRQRDAVGLSIFTDKVVFHSAAKGSTTHHRLLFAQLENLLQQEPLNVPTQAARCLHEIAETTHKRSLIIIFSDMFDYADTQYTDDLFSALQHLRYNKHEVVLFHTVDKRKELEFEYENRPYRFIDMETGEEVKLHSGQVREHYVTQMRKYESELRLRCGQYNIDFVEADINEDFRQVLMPFLVKRSKLF
ncbi:MAG: DUF58 domain-containing protein [Chitinophagales bacterium]|nr:DUF58 domain-containing protein [Chitinophagales bacterium]MDW8419166.1 DUF58 domain-containing protein [Chitinophagales bacterium]